MSKRYEACCLIHLCILMFLCAASGTAFAQQPNRSWELNAVNIVEGGEELVASTYDSWAQSLAKLREGEDLIKNKPKLKKIAAALGDSVILAQKTRRNAKILLIMGEPAGVDLQKRSDDLFNKLKWFRDEKYRTNLAPLRAIAEQERDRNARFLKKSRVNTLALVAKRQYQKAEEELNNCFDTIGGWMFFLNSSDQRKIIQPFTEAFVARTKMNEQRAVVAKKAMESKYRATVPQLSEFSRQLKEKLDKFKTQGSIGVDVSSSDYGPNLLRSINNLLQKKHVDAYRALMIATILDNKEFKKSCDRIINAVEKRYFESVVEILSADRDYCKPQNAEQLYFDYLRKLVPILMVNDNRSFRDQCEKLILAIASKSTSLSAQVYPYVNATNELLYWRNQVAVDKMNAAKKDAISIRAMIRKRIEDFDDKRKLKLVMITQKRAVPSGLEFGLNRIWPFSEKNLTGSSAVFNNLQYRGALGYVGLVDRYWARSSNAIDVEEQVDSLRTDLLSSKELPPLSLSAAVSLASANLKRFSLASCRITGVQFESIADRIVNLPEKATFLLPVGDGMEEFALNQMVVRLEIEPDWVQHEHFFVDLKQRETVSTTRDDQSQP